MQTIADAMGLGSVEEAAEGILAIVNENMAGALRLVSVQRGHDPREFALVAYGGAGPLHANAVAEIMGSFPVLVPPAPGLLCAIGDLVADFRDEFAQTYIRVLGDAEPAEVGRRSSRRSARGRRSGSTARASPTDARTITYTADMRYHRPGLRDPGGDRPRRGRAAASPSSRSGSTCSTSSSTGSACRARRARSSTCARSARAPCRSRSCRSASAGGADASGAVVEEHEIVFKGERLPTKIYDRAKLAPGNRFDGPAIVTEFDSTTVVLPGYAAEVDANFNILINPKA